MGIERKEITDDEDDDEEFQKLQEEAEELGASDDDAPVDSDDEDLNDFNNLKKKMTDKQTKRLLETKRSGLGDPDQAIPAASPKILERDVVIDDFIRNFLQRFAMKKTMN